MMDPNATDEQLLSAFVDGDREALGELARRHEQALLGLARGLLGGQSAVALDAVQETWMRVIRYGNSFNGRSSVKTWLYRIAVNRCRDLRVTRQLAVPAAESNHTTDQASDGASMRQEVCEVLREAVGLVESEQLSGEDVTSQVVDLEARLRNEQRVEAELLDLLESRQDAPLREILDLRRQLNIVRMSIERLTAQRQRIGRLVTLATVLVIIRPEDAPQEPEPKAGLGHYFGERMLASWGGGLRLLTNTMAGALRLLVGGLLWWVILLIVLLRVRQYVRQQKMQEAVA